MSSARSGRQTSRRETRNTNSSPYSRPVAAKKSSWSLSGLMSYLNPFAWTTSESGSLDSEAAHALSRRGQELAAQREEAPSNAEHEPHSPMDESDSPDAAPSGPSPPSALDPHAASALNLTAALDADELGIDPARWETIRLYLNERQGQKLHTVEAAGIVALLNQGITEEEKPEPFRFSTTSPTPEPGTTINSGATSPDASSPEGPAPPPPKMLAKNPNGTYRWNGGGSARKRPRNRYQSPGFGTSASTTPSLKIIPEKPKTDTKRRRVGEEAQSSSAQRVPLISAPGTRPYTNGTTQPSTGSSNGTTSRTNGIASSSKSPPAQTNGTQTPPPALRLRTPGPFRPTTPAVPSPLRQTWGQTDSSSPPQPSPPSVKPTRAADFMTQLLKEVTPPKKKDFANPYQTASPMPVRPPTKKPPARKTKAASKAAAEATPEKKGLEKDLSELSPQAIIEATVPKGSKRARPPPDLKATKAAAEAASASTSASPRRSARLKSPSPPLTSGMDAVNSKTRRLKHSRAMVVEEVDEEISSPPKKQKTNTSQANGRPSLPASGRSQTVTVEEVSDVSMESASRPSYTLPSEVVEPAENGSGNAKSRSTSPTTTAAFAAVPFGSSAPTASNQRGGFGGLKTSAPRAPSKLRYSFMVEQEEKEKEREREKEKEKTAASSGPAPPVFGASSFPSFKVPPPPKPAIAKLATPKNAKAIVLAMAVRELPQYSFTFPTSSPGAGPSFLKARKEALAVPTSSLPTFNFAALPKPVPTTAGFNWAAAGMKAPAKSAGGTWKCGECMLDNPASATEKCTVCDARRADSLKPAAPATFNWAAAGMAQPKKPEGETWTCSTCMLTNPASATTKCSVCETPR
ncbi:hypothetical protein B0H21DRAFT_699261 [Amylocystis lapponica]|nr:hypothetical protein B0H21DRAFT_699261 [Amylocystis lapponica]